MNLNSESRGKHAASENDNSKHNRETPQHGMRPDGDKEAEGNELAGTAFAIEGEASANADETMPAEGEVLASADEGEVLASADEDGADAPIDEASQETPPEKENLSADASDLIGEADTCENQTGFVAAAYGETRAKRRRKGLKVFGVTMGIIVVVLLAAYLAGAVVFMGRFLPNTSIGSKDISLKTDEEVTSMLEDLVSDYRLDIVGSGFSYRLASEDIQLKTDADAIVSAMHDDMSAWKWPLLIIQPGHDESGLLSVTYKRDAYEQGLVDEIGKFNETAKDPVNATISFDAAKNKFVVQPEILGTKLDAKAVLESTAQAIGNLEPKAIIGEEQTVKPTVYSTDKKLIEAAELASGMVSAHLTLVMGGQNVGEVDGSALSEFVTVNDQFEVTFRDEELDEWVENLARSFDTVGTERIYTRADGKEIAVSGGVYGWEVDSEELRNALLDSIRAGAVTELEVPCIDTAAVYNGPNQPDWGARYIDVDISEQYVRFYGDDGSIIWEAPCISGSPDGKHDTVPGVWSVNGKESPSKLIGYENGKKIYETSVQYWMPFEGNGIGFHDATWQPSFGGSMYADGYGSHGCVNIPPPNMPGFYNMVSIGTPVIVHY